MIEPTASNVAQLQDMNQTARLLRRSGFSFMDHGTWLVVNDPVHRVAGDLLQRDGSRSVTIRSYADGVRFVSDRS